MDQSINNEKGFAQYIHLIIGVIVGIALIEILTVILKNQNPTPVTSLLTTPTPIVKSNASPVAKSKVDLAQINKYLTVEAALLGISDNLSLYFKDLNQPDQEVAFNPTRSWIPASTIKSFVVLEAFRQRDLGLINFNQAVTITADNVVPTELETDDYPRLREGTQATVHQLLGAMITQSDNTAYNTLLDLLDRRNINNTLKNYGLTETVVGEKLNLDDNQFQQDLTVPGRQNNTTTVKDLATFFDLLYTHQMTDAEEILAIFKKQKINNMIPALLPTDTIIAHKTGDWAPIFHDGGVIYKKDDPFILSVFTNANNPGDIAQLAKVAYFNSAQVVGQDISSPNKPLSQNSNAPTIYLAESENESNVLGVEQSRQTPTVTAEDLGITPSDLSLSSSEYAQKVSNALIAPNSFLYGFKRALENVSLSLPWNQKQTVSSDFYLTHNRLSELKTSLGQGDLNSSEKVLAESEDNLKNAVQTAQKGSSTNSDLTQAKQLNDLQYATLAEAAKNIPSAQKEQFIDLVYRFAQKNNQEVKPTLTKSVIANPLQQKPLVGTVKQISSQNIQVQFDDGSQKTIVINQFTPVRDFHSDQLDSRNNLPVGSKIAIVAQTTPNGSIVPQFILKNIPHELPDRHQGTVLEIDPKDRVLTIKEDSRKTLIQVSDKTIVKGSDTTVSLEGIKAGSQVTVFGEYESTPTASINPHSSSIPNSNTSNLPYPKPSGTVGPVSNPNSKASSNPHPNQPATQIIIKATTISVTQNGSGKHESRTPSKNESKSAPTPKSNKK